MTTHLTSGIISALITTLGGVPWNRLWDGDSQAEGLCPVINNLVERRKQRRYLNCWHGFTKKASPDLPELDAFQVISPGESGSPFIFTLTDQALETSCRGQVCVWFWAGQHSSVEAIPDIWQSPQLGRCQPQMLRGDLGAHCSIYPSLSLMPLRFMCVNIINSGSSSSMIPFGLFLWKLTKVSGINNSACHCRWSQSHSRASFPCLPPF